MNYVNQKDVHLMIWEPTQTKRNLNNEIKFNIPISENVSVGDQILCPKGEGKSSCYEITEILEIKPSTISKMNYVTAKTKWFIN